MPLRREPTEKDAKMADDSSMPPVKDRPEYSFFKLSEEDAKKVSEWWKKHCEEKHADKMRGEGPTRHIYTGAIGGGLSYIFHPNSVGESTVAKCFCGDKLDFTDYDCW